jgi:hypothetical protein
MSARPETTQILLPDTQVVTQGNGKQVPREVRVEAGEGASAMVLSFRNPGAVRLAVGHVTGPAVELTQRLQGEAREP